MLVLMTGEWRTAFEWDGMTGEVRVECVPNDDPAEYGTALSDAYGFPVCTASVRYPRRGYRAMFGWVQLVRSTDNGSHGEAFEIDPLALFGDVRMPYCWYGTEPTLFDSPCRLDRTPLAWRSRSVLATTPIAEVLRLEPRRVVPLVGFEWGFDVRDDGTIELSPTTALTNADWHEVLPVLRSEYPEPFWVFADTLG
jgi:hypothetical protein